MDKQIYDGYKPIVCEVCPSSQSMSLIRNGEWVGYVKVNSGLGGPVRMFGMDDVVINFQVRDHFWLSFNDMQIIREAWEKMQKGIDSAA
jgi:hypothetical protein